MYNCQKSLTWQVIAENAFYQLFDVHLSNFKRFKIIT